MRQLICILFGLFMYFTAYAKSSVSEIYDDFQKVKSNFLSSKPLRKDFSKKFKKLDADLNDKFLQLKSIEKVELTEEGNQLALDLELLQPIRDLASRKINKDTCSQALNLNQLNLTEEEKTQIQAIEKIIKSLCS